MFRNEKSVIPRQAKLHWDAAVVRLHLHMREALLPTNAYLPGAIGMVCFQRRLLRVKPLEDCHVRCLQQKGEECLGILQQVMFCRVVVSRHNEIIPLFVRECN